MINHINELLNHTKGVNTSLTGKENTIIDAHASSAPQNELNKEMMVYLSKIQLGDILKGQLILQNGQTVLQLENGLTLFAQLAQQVTNGQMQSFEVIGKERQHLILQMKNVEDLENTHGQNFIEQAMGELGLEKNELLKSAMSEFIAKQLPLAKQQLVQVMQFAKHFEMPTAPFTNLLVQNQNLSTEEAQYVANYKLQGKEGLMQQLDDVLDCLNGEQKQLETLILKTFSPKEIITYLSKEQALLDKPALNHLLHKIPHNQADVLVNDELYQSLQLEINDDYALLDKIFQDENFKDLKSIFKGLVREQLVVEHDKLQDFGEAEKLSQAATLLKKVTAHLKEISLEAIDYTKIDQLQKLSEALDKYNMNAQYFCFPFQIKEQEAKGELYFFKPHKKKKKGETDQYIVLALTMPHLNKIEIHIKNKGDSIDFLVKVKEKEMKKLIEEHEIQLRQLLEDSSFKIGEVKCQWTDEAIKSNNQIGAYTHSTLTSMDARI